FQERDGLSGSVQRDTGDIGRAKIIADKCAARTGTGLRNRVRRRIGMMQRGRMRRLIIIEPANVKHRNRKVERRLGVRREKIAGLARMLIGAHRDVKCAFDVRHGTAHVQDGAIRMSCGYSKVVGAGEGYDGLIVGVGWTECRGELPGSQEMMELRISGVVELLDEPGERIAIAQRESEGEIQARIGWEASKHRRRADRRGNVAGEALPSRCEGIACGREKQNQQQTGKTMRRAKSLAASARGAARINNFAGHNNATLRAAAPSGDPYMARNSRPNHGRNHANKQSANEQSWVLMNGAAPGAVCHANRLYKRVCIGKWNANVALLDI